MCRPNLSTLFFVVLPLISACTGSDENLNFFRAPDEDASIAKDGDITGSTEDARTADSESSTKKDGGTEPQKDASLSQKDASSPPKDASSPPKDAANDGAPPPPKDAGSPLPGDSGPIGTTDPTPSLRQCVQDSECGAGLTCAADIAWGFCKGCQSENVTCPSFASTCEEGQGGTCTISCKTDNQCPTPLYCANLGGGKRGCRQRKCSSDADCAPLHECGTVSGSGNNKVCKRIACKDGRPCPAKTHCDDTSLGALCVEDI